MGYQNILVGKEENFAIITINKPPANALSPEITTEISSALSELEGDANLRSIIFTGAGEKIFSAGADLSSAFAGVDIDKIIKNFQETFNRIERYHLPVIAAINGHALGGGCELVLACHFRIMKKTARIGLTESNLGIIPGAGGTQRMPRLIGKARALDYIIFGRQIPAEEALSIGLVHKISEERKVLDDAKELARRLGVRAPFSTRFIIDSVVRGLEVSIDEGILIERENFLKVIKTEDAGEGIRAFFNRRKPDFKGK